MRVSPKFAVVFIAAVIAMWAIAGYLQSKDEALAGLQEFLGQKKQVTDVTGAQPSITVHNSVFYQGVPGKEDPYREYRVTAKGSQGTIDLTVRAFKFEDQSSWSHQLWAINK